MQKIKNIMKTKFKNFVNESQEESGEIILNVDGVKTTWYFINDAIQNGLLEETLDLTDEIINDYAENMENFHDFGFISMEELTDILIGDFQIELGKLLIYLIEIDYLDKDIFSVTIDGEDEDGEEFDLQFDYAEIK